MLSLEREQSPPMGMHGQPSPQMEQVTIEYKHGVIQD
jgi:hypothetical protein